MNQAILKAEPLCKRQQTGNGMRNGLSVHPVDFARREWMKFMKNKKNKGKEFDNSVCRTAIINQIRVMRLSNCIDLYSNKEMKCSCFMDLELSDEEQEDLCSHLFEFSKLEKREEQQRVLGSAALSTSFVRQV